MFQDWGFLLTEIWVLLALASLIGLIAGWLIWGGRADTGADVDEIRRLQAELDREKARGRTLMPDPLNDVPMMEGGGYVRPNPPVTTPAAPLPVPPAVAPVIEQPETPSNPADGAEPRTKPQGLETARDGLPDDLTMIRGIGPKMAKLCNSLGFWHFDQIAKWSAQEVAWVDDNLEGFKGRVTRDDWVAQAKKLAVNQSPAFTRRNV